MFVQVDIQQFLIEGCMDAFVCYDELRLNRIMEAPEVFKCVLVVVCFYQLLIFASKSVISFTNLSLLSFWQTNSSRNINVTPFLLTSSTLAIIFQLKPILRSKIIRSTHRLVKTLTPWKKLIVYCLKLLILRLKLLSCFLNN